MTQEEVHVDDLSNRRKKQQVASKAAKAAKAATIAEIKAQADAKRAKQQRETDEPEEEDFSWLKVEGVEELPDVEPEIIINGLLHVGEKLGISAKSKSFKTWLLLHLAYCVGNGFDFLGFKTQQAKVIVFDLELSRFGLRRRLERIRQELGGQGDFSHVKICALRGKARRFRANLAKVKELIAAGQYKVVIIDPVYKFLLGKEENSNGIVADMLEDLTEFCMDANIAIIYVHHHSKGNQSGKDSMERSSGAGAWSRDPDAIMDLTEQETSTKEQQIYTVAITLREFPPVLKFVVRWVFPLLVRDKDGLDPEKLKQPPKNGGRPSDTADQIIIALRVAECEAGLPGLKAKQIARATGLTVRTVQRHLTQLSPKRCVKSVAAKGYQLSVEERGKVPSVEREDGDE
jgi:RecA-family ATPase